MRDILLDMPDDDPFENDQFEREAIARNFMKIFEKDEDGIVLAIDSNWGTGKTTFIKMWEKLVNNDKSYKKDYETIYFNAWDNDYIENPLLALFTEIQLKKTSKDITSEVFNEVFSPMTRVIKRLLDIGIKFKTEGALGIDDFNFINDLNKDGTDKDLISIGDELLNRALCERKLRDDFRKEIENIQRQSNSNSESKKRIIFFIDELDRCRPKFAIELLETIKHLFSAPGIIFVISLDKNQLSHSVATVYGQNMDTVGYLRRFFDIEYKLPKADKIKYMNVKNQNTFEGYLNTKYLEQFLDGFIIGYNFSLRDIDKLHYYLKILMPLIEEYREHYRPDDCKLITISYLYAYLISLKIKRPDLYDKIINIEYDYDSYDEVLKLKETYKFNFYKKDGLEIGIIRTIKDNVIKNFITLNYLRRGDSEANALISTKKFNIELDAENNLDMRELFDPDGKCSIILNMEFMNSLL
ncbi:KAP family P-loop NTPase fold protein [Paraclostridium sordellii]|uniref:KAP family P-loop NTPase fold protein n=1 Tax=Paraclostridium sordellii TaxID=1505 RepID=UPI0005E95DD0|nr:P-loop NTPase fold protein [Paeniclostridium sordellii]CEN80987.1 Predicted P-loop ATPase [[Clostridium] sordellii] [Paeniclostridium sordellii]